jgi:hypothetical protein
MEFFYRRIAKTKSFRDLTGPYMARKSGHAAVYHVLALMLCTQARFSSRLFFPLEKLVRI